MGEKAQAQSGRWERVRQVEGNAGSSAARLIGEPGQGHTYNPWSVSKDMLASGEVRLTT